MRKTLRVIDASAAEITYGSRVVGVVRQESLMMVPQACDQFALAAVLLQCKSAPNSHH
jgi:hypothetical protein